MGELFTQCTEALHRFRAQLYEDGTGYSGALDRQEDGLARFAFHFQTDLLGYLTITPDPPGDHVLVRVTTPDGALTIEGTDYLPAPPILPSDPHGKLKRLLRLLSEDLDATLTRPAETPTEPTTKTRQSGPSAKVEERARVFSQLAAEHPDWTQLQVAMAARELLEEPHIDANTVRNAYRAMGWSWRDR